ncbi:MAG: hypothetical protein K0U45_02590 [Alphaproteobacteria bacterium]|nr:hypothetical protein [Alphaproteobacteria bacterium]
MMKKFAVYFITILFLFNNAAHAQQSEILENEIILVTVFGILTGALAYKTFIDKDEETETEEKVSFLAITSDEDRLQPYWNLYNDGSDNKLETGIKFKF